MKTLNNSKAWAGTSRLKALLAISTILWLVGPEICRADVWTGRVVNGWTFQTAFLNAGQSLTNANAAMQSAFDNVRDDTDGGALALHNAFAGKGDTIAAIQKKWFSVCFDSVFPVSSFSISNVTIRSDYAALATENGNLVVHLSTNKSVTQWWKGGSVTSTTNTGNIAYTGGSDTSYTWNVTSYLDTLSKITNCEVLVLNRTNSTGNLYFGYFQIEVIYTPLTAPVVTNSIGATAVTTNSATLNGQMLGGGPPPQTWFYWGTNDAGQTINGWNFTNDMGLVAKDSSFSNNISGLPAGQTYYYRCSATNIYGTNWDVNPAAFTTLQTRVEFSATTASGVESISPALIPVTLAATSGVPVSVMYSVIGGTGASDDFTLTNGTLTIQPGSTVGYINIAITNDTTYESNETFVIAISNATGAILGANTQCTYTIINDDLPPLVYFTNMPYSVLENLTNFIISVGLSQPSEIPVTVDYSTAAGTASNVWDYTNVNGTLSWPPGDSSIKTFKIPIVDDSVQEVNETIFVSLSNTNNCTIGGASTVTATIVDNDSGPPVIYNDMPGGVTSNSATLKGILSSTGGVPTFVWVYWGQQDGTNNKLSWSTNQYMGSLSVNPFSTNITGLARNTQYWYRCYASNSYGGAWAPDSTNFLTGPPTVQFLTSSLSGSESNSPVMIELRLSAPSTYGLPVTVNYSVIGGTASNITDYLLVASNITIAAGNSGTNISFTVNNDSIYEDNETLLVGISNIQNAVAGPNTNCLYTIMDNDPAPTVSFANTPYSVMENGTNITIPVVLSTNTERLVSIAYTTSDGTAKDGTAYTNRSGTLNWLRGQGGTNTFTIPIIDNLSQGGNTYFYLTLSAPSNCTILGNSFTNVTIIEDDNIAPVVTNRGASNIQWTVASLNGFMTTSYPPATAYIYWGTNDGGTTASSWTHTNNLGTTPGLFSIDIAGLVANTKYFFRCFATNSVWPASSDWADVTAVFTTKPPWIVGVSNYYVNDGSTAGDLYCSATGRVTNIGTNPATPKVSVQNILDAYHIRPGDVIWVDTGFYTTPLTITTDDAGASGNPVIIRGTTGPQGSVLNGAATDVININPGADYIRIESLGLTGGANGLYASGCLGIQVIGCNVYNNTAGTAGIYLLFCTDPVVSNTVSANNSVHGIYLESCNGGSLWGNECYGNVSCGIRAYDTQNPVIILNTCHDQLPGDPEMPPTETGIFIGYGPFGSSTGETVISNRCYSNPHRGIDLRTGVASIVSGNVCWSNTFEGLYLEVSSLSAVGNIAYTNQGNGFYASGYGSLTIRNNQFYNNIGYQMQANLPDQNYSSLIENNTLVGGNGMLLADRAMVTNRNNIIWAAGVTPDGVTTNVAIRLGNAPNGVVIFASDYNDLFVTNGAAVGGIDDTAEIFSTLEAWTNAVALDLNSISVNPRFVDPAIPDFHLQSPAGSYHSGTWQGDPAYSPCIDAGDPWCSFSPETFYNGLIVNQGAYGNTPEASRTAYAGTWCTVTISTQPVSAGSAQVWPQPSTSGYPTNRIITVRAAVTNDGYLWEGWKGGLSDTNTLTSFYATGTMSVVASFTSKVFAITATALQGGSISPSGIVSVAWNSNQTFSISNSAGSSISNVLVDGDWQGPTNSWTFFNVTSAHSIDAWFQPATSIVAASAGPGGSISPSGNVVVAWGMNQSFTISTNAGYAISNVVVDSVSKGITNNWTFIGVTNGHTIVASFKTSDTLTITASAGTGGSIVPGTVSVTPGADQSFAISNNLGYTISNVVVDSVSQGITNGWKFTNVTNSHTIAAWFQPLMYTITASGRIGGSISPSGTVSVAGGSDQAFAISNSYGYTVSNIMVDSAWKGPTNSWTFSNVTASHSIDAWFQPATSIITATAGPGGLISPSGNVAVAWISNQTFTISTNLGYAISNVVVDSVSQGITNSWQFTSVTNSHTIMAWFRLAPAFTTNGTPVSWLLSYGYSGDQVAADWTDDDGDKSYTWQEYQAGTDPTNALSVFKVLSTQYKPGSNRIAWYATTNSGVYTYMQIYRSTNLRYSTWELRGSNLDRQAAITGTNYWWDVTPPTSGIPAFYRVAMTNQYNQ